MLRVARAFLVFVALLLAAVAVAAAASGRDSDRAGARADLAEGFQNAGLVGRRWVALLSGITRARNYQIALGFAGD